ncbi:hypothetical protein CPC08DRAFT_815662 [Agrocybe pediades]|nr:hypothetical protein CPC08DRAFT_815662 [Agrocybe pediades]
MKITISFFVASSIAFITSAVQATPAPAPSLITGPTPAIIECAGPDRIQCPTGFRCCIGPLSPTLHPFGHCEEGIVGPCAL